MKKLLSVITLVASTFAGAQTLVTGDLTGRVTDATGAVVAGARVTLKSLDEGSVQVDTTSSSGTFRFPLLKPGNYVVHEEGSGLRADATVGINLGQATSLNLVAKPSGNETVIDVSGEPLLQTEDANISTTFSQAQIDTLPIPGGDISNLPFTTPGANVSTGEGYGNFNVFGLPSVSNLFTTNGSDLMDAYLNLPNSGASNNVLGANEINEAAVVVNGYTGQYGRLAGAQVNFTTRSGTNDFHGNAIFYYNSSGFNANDWFLKAGQLSSGTINAQPHAVSRQWGGRIGGPILKNKLFAFFDDEGLRYVLPGGGVTTYLPSTAFANAVQAHIAAVQPAESAYYRQIFALYAGANGASGAQPVTGTTDGGCGDIASTNGAIVGGQQTTFGTLQGVTFGGSPGATPCAVSYVPNNNNLNTEQLYSVRLDANLTAKDQANARFKHDWGVQATSTDPINPAFSANSVQPEYEGQFNETHIFSPKIVNSFTMASLYYSAVFGPPNFGAAIATFPTVLTFGQSPFQKLGGSDNSYPSGRNVSQYQFEDDLSVNTGKHSMKFGYNFRRYNITNFAPLAGNAGSTNFASTTDFTNGLISNSNAGGTSTVTQAFAQIEQAHLSLYSIGAYAQDQWAVTPKLNLTASLRFDRAGNPACRGNCFVRFGVPFQQANHLAATPYNASIITGQSNAFPSVESVTIQPRIGFALTPFGPTGHTVIRGGGGLFADLPVASILTRFITAAPNYVSFTVTPNATYPTYTVQPGLASSGYSAAKASFGAFETGFSQGLTLATIQNNVKAAGSSYSTPTYSATTESQLKNPKFVEFNLEVQQTIGRHDVFDINYVGNYGFDILYANAGVNAYASCYAAGKCPAGYGDLPTTAIDTRFTAVTDLTNQGYSNYNGLVVSYRHQGSYGFSGSINYTYSHSLDTDSNGGIEGFQAGSEATFPLTAIDPNSQQFNYGNADYDIRNNLNLNYSWILPYKFSNGFERAFLQGWQIAGTLYDKSGQPFSVIRGSLAATYTASTNGGSSLAYRLAPQAYSCGRPMAGGTLPCLSSANYGAPATVAGVTQYNYGFGNQSRNSYRGPGYFDTDMQLSKETPVHGKIRFRIGANIFNLVNHPNFAVPLNNVASTSTFGKIQADVPPVSSPYGNFQGAGVSGRILQVQGGFTF
jgi:outer membrane receptor protein involved in Fe transport